MILHNVIINMHIWLLLHIQYRVSMADGNSSFSSQYFTSALMGNW